MGFRKGDILNIFGGENKVYSLGFLIRIKEKYN